MVRGKMTLTLRVALANSQRSCTRWTQLEGNGLASPIALPSDVCTGVAEGSANGRPWMPCARSDRQTHSQGWATPVEEGVWLSSAGPRREHVHALQEDPWRSTACA